MGLVESGLMRILSAIVLVLAALWAMDTYLPSDPVEEGVAAGRAEQTTRTDTLRGRTLALIFDGLRLETALDTTLMPNLQALRRRGAHAELETVYEGFSVPAIRAAFSGIARTSLFSVVQNFHHADLGVESVFSQLRDRNRRSAVMDYGHFKQFGNVYDDLHPEPLPGEDMYARDRRGFDSTLAWYAGGRYDLVVGHYESTDWVAHQHGIFAAEYATEYRVADSLIGVAARALAPGDHLVVFGDHGHNATGEHKTGMDIPSVVVAVGPAFRSGHDMGVLPISNLRYLFAAALGLPVHRSGYRYDRLDAALAAGYRPELRDAPAEAGQRAHPVRAYGLYLAAFGLWLAAAALWWRRWGAATPAPTAWGAVALATGAPAVGAVGVALFPLLLAAAAWGRRQAPRVAAAAAATAAYFLLAPNTGSGMPIGWGAVGFAYAAGLAAKAWLWWQLGRRSGQAFLGLGLGVLVALDQLAVLENLIPLPPHLTDAGLFLALLAASLGFRRAPHVPHLLLTAALWVLASHQFRLSLYHWMWLDLFLAAWLVAGVGTPWRLWMLLAALFAIPMQWTDSAVEWRFIYDWFPSELAETQVWWFLPMILAKWPVLLLAADRLAPPEDPTTSDRSLPFAAIGMALGMLWIIGLWPGMREAVWLLGEWQLYALLWACWAAALPRLGRITPARLLCWSAVLGALPLLGLL